MSLVDLLPTQTAFSRRTMLGASLGALTVSALQIPATHAQNATPSPGGDWSFTDDKGITVTLPSQPVRIVADVNAAAPLWDFGIRPVAVFGWNASETGDFGPAGGNVDPDAVEVVGNVTEPFQLEPAIAMQPDLFLTLSWAPDDPTEYWSISADILPQVLQIAPIVALSATGSADINTERFAELAESLGADLGSPELVAAKARYDAVLSAFPGIAATKSDLSILFIYAGNEEMIYVANPSDWADLALYHSLGLSLVQPDADPGSYWEALSFEQAIKYPADILFNSTRPGMFDAEELKAHPIFSQHPAVKAGQIGAWNQDFIMSYQGMATALETIIGVITNATKVT